MSVLQKAGIVCEEISKATIKYDKCDGAVRIIRKMRDAEKQGVVAELRGLREEKVVVLRIFAVFY